MAFPNGYGYRRKITIDNTKVSGGSNHSNFTVLISGVYDGTAGEPNLKDTGNGGYVQSSNGYDIIFTFDEAGNTQLDHEIEKYVAATGEIVMWVRIPTLLYNSDTIIYMWYGKSGASDPSTTDTWNSNYKGVWHLGESAGDAKDSTSNGNDGTFVGSLPDPKDGQIGKAQDLDGDDYISVPHSASIDLSEKSFSVSAWIDYSVAGMVIGKRTGGTTPYIYLWGAIAGKVNWASINDIVNNATPSCDTNFSVGQNYLVLVWNWSEKKAYLYLNGNEVGTATNASVGDIDDGGDLGIGARGGDMGQNPAGLLDECHLSTGIALTADWIATEYNNQNSPSTFYSVGGLYIGMVSSDNF